jgi:phosphoribosylformylglycinamidine synthase
MAGRAGNGVRIDLDCVPRRAKAMQPYEILLSESQERMLLVSKPGHEEKVLAICKRWDLDAAVIGEVTDTRRWVITATPGYDPMSDPESKRAPVVVCDLPVGVLTDDAPVYQRARMPPSARREPIASSAIRVPAGADLARELLDLVGSPNVGSRAWVWRQYDQIVRGGTAVRPGSDAGVVTVRWDVDGRVVEKTLAFAADCNGRMVELDAFTGGAMAVAEVCRNLVCSGAEPIGMTDCLNFGSPERPEVMESFARAIDGIAAGCKRLGVPIVSGNVSLYNETDRKAILPTPTVAAVGLVAKPGDVVTSAFKRAGDAVILLGRAVSSGVRALGGSEWLVARTSGVKGEGPEIDLDAEVALQGLVLGLAREGLLQSAHDVSDGGMAATLAECCALGAEPVGAKVELPAEASAVDALAALFGEAPSRVVVSVAAGTKDRVLARAKDAGVPATILGSTGGDRLEIAAAPLGKLSVAVAEVIERRNGCLKGIVGD